MKKLLTAAVAALILAACASDNVEPPAPLQPLLKPQLVAHEIWSRSISGYDKVQGINLAPTSDGSQVFVSTDSGEVYAFSVNSGGTNWKTKTKLDAGAGATYGDGLVVLAATSGTVVALDATSGDEKWRADVKGEILATPAVGLGFVVVRTTDGRVIALAADSGQQRWKNSYDQPRLILRGQGTPRIVDRTLLIGLDNGKLLALGIDDGKQLWEATVSNPVGSDELSRLTDVDGALSLGRDDIYAVGYHGQTVDVSRYTGQIRWSRDLASATGASTDGDYVYVTDNNDGVWALEKSNGVPIWSQPVLRARDLTVPVPMGSALVVGDLQGYLHFISKKDGSLLGRERVDSDPITAAPIVVGDKLIVQTTNSDVAAYILTPPS